MSDFPITAPSAYPVFYRTYSRNQDGYRESWNDVCDRTIYSSVSGLKKVGMLTPEETKLIYRMQREAKTFPSGRWLWVGGTEWYANPANRHGAYNCTTTTVDSPEAFGYMMNLAMMGCGTGANLEAKHISKLPKVSTKLNVSVIGSFSIGGSPNTEVKKNKDRHFLIVGDSRKGWVDAYQYLIDLAFDNTVGYDTIDVVVDISNVRPSGEKLKSFGGTANPVKIPNLFPRIGEILNGALGRQLKADECCLLIDEAALVVVAGSIRRSAGMRQLDHDTPLLKTNLWQQDSEGNWSIDPKRDALRMANHTRVFHHKPTLEECIDSVRSQYYSGEGAIQYAPEAERRAGGEGRYELNPCGSR